MGILCRQHDSIVNSSTIDAFANKHNGSLTILNNGEHYFHLKEPSDYAKEWIKDEI